MEPLGPRRVLHCDMDCFYAAVHMRDDPSLAGKPVVIGGRPDSRGVVAAASYEVRKFGVRSAMPASRARTLCPEAVFIRPDFNRYRRESQEIVAIFRRFTPIVQVVSIDEAYLDVTESLDPWGSATAVAEEIRRVVREERALTVSVGVGPNRLIAKIASDRDKPDGLTVVPPSRVRSFLDPLQVRSLPGVGPATDRRLARLSIRTIADLRALTESELVARLGRMGSVLYRYARGVDERPVRTHRERKSLSSERTYETDLQTLEEMDEELAQLADQVARGLEKREISGCTVTVKVRYADFTTVSRSSTLRSPTRDGTTILATARELLRKTDAGSQHVRLLGIGAANLVHANVAQLSLLDGLLPDPDGLHVDELADPEG